MITLRLSRAYGLGCRLCFSPRSFGYRSSTLPLKRLYLDFAVKKTGHVGTVLGTPPHLRRVILINHMHHSRILLQIYEPAAEKPNKRAPPPLKGRSGADALTGPTGFRLYLLPCLHWVLTEGAFFPADNARSVPAETGPLISAAARPAWHHLIAGREEATQDDSSLHTSPVQHRLRRPAGPGRGHWRNAGSGASPLSWTPSVTVVNWKFS